jgi:hypothetical protein
MNDTEREQLIREQAYRLWLAEGKPEGRESAHWGEAERLVKRIEEARKADKSGHESPIAPSLVPKQG